MCGSNSSDAADEYYAEQRRLEEDRQAKIEEGLGVVRGQFTEEARSPIYQQSYDNALAIYMNDLQGQYEKALANMRVNNARSSQSAGSLGAQRKGQLKNTYDKGVVQAQQLAQQLKEGLFSQDQNTKGSLINQIYGGLGATDALDIALSQMKSNENNALRNSRNDGLGDLFADLGGTYTNYKKQQGVNAGKDTYGSYFSNGSTSGGGAQQVT